MAYGVKYRFRVESIHGVTYAVTIAQDGYSGAIIDRPLGKAPVLKKSNNGNICSTSLDLVLECHTDGEYAEFYSTDPHEFIANLFRGNTLIWSGFLVTESYSAPEIAPPYDVKVVATDGIADSKMYDFEAQGNKTLKQLFRYLLSDASGLGRSIYMVSKIGSTGLTPANFFNTALINLDYMAGKSKYEVLTYLLDTLHATITVHNGDWLIVRETDVVVSGGSIWSLYAPSRSDAVSESSISNTVASAGQMGVADLWPVGHMSTDVVPAKRRVSIEAPYHPVSGAPSVANNEWTIYDGDHVMFLGGNYIFTYATLDEEFGTIYSNIAFRSFSRDLQLSLVAAADQWYGSRKKPELAIFVSFTPTGGTTMYYDGNVWTTTAKVIATLNPPRDHWKGEEYTFDIPYLEEFSAGVFSIEIQGRFIKLSSVNLYSTIGNGYKDTIKINNGARGDGDTVAIAGGRIGTDDVVSAAFLQGIFLLSGAPVENFSDYHFSDKDFLSLTVLGYATSVALPRLQLSGTLDLPTSLNAAPLVLTYDGVSYWVESYELNVKEAELRVTAVSLPAANLSVESETVTELADSQGTGTPGSGPGSASGTVINTIVESKVSFGPTGNSKTILSVNGESRTLLLEGWTELPAVGSSDNGKVLKVVSGAWTKAAEKTELPAPLSGDDGKALVIVDGLWEKAFILPAVSSSDNGKVLKVTSGAWAKGSLAAVASSGNYNDLSNKPAIPTYYTGTGAPASSLGNDGDIYLQTTS